MKKRVASVVVRTIRNFQTLLKVLELQFKGKFQLLGQLLLNDIYSVAYNYDSIVSSSEQTSEWRESFKETSDNRLIPSLMRYRVSSGV